MTDEEPLKKPKEKAKPLLDPNNESDLAYGIHLFANGISLLTKELTKKKNTTKAQVEHNEKLITMLKAEIDSKKKIEEQYNEYKKLIDELRLLEEKKKAMKDQKGNMIGK